MPYEEVLSDYKLQTKVREAAKRKFFLNGSAIKALPPPLELIGSRIFFNI